MVATRIMQLVVKPFLELSVFKWLVPPLSQALVKVTFKNLMGLNQYGYTDLVSVLTCRLALTKGESCVFLTITKAQYEKKSINYDYEFL